MPGAGVIILAAGGSRRMGQPKQLLSFRGRSLLRHAAETALQSICRPVLVVLGSDLDWMQKELKGLDIRAVSNPDWNEGMASSIRAALSAADLELSGVVMMLCDQPFVSSEALNQLAASPDELAAAEYGGTVGVPAYFPKRFFPALRALEGNAGAKSILLENPARRIPCPEASMDIDTPEEARQLQSSPRGRSLRD
jgi:molybdenum cofactor cytidylyltransferase